MAKYFGFLLPDWSRGQAGETGRRNIEFAVSEPSVLNKKYRMPNK